MTKTRDLADLGGGFIQAGTGAVQRTVESKLQDVVSVKDFGAVGDGVTDDTNAIQTALDVAFSLNKNVYIPSGKYIFTTLRDIRVTVYGDGWRSNTREPFGNSVWSEQNRFSGTVLISTATSGNALEVGDGSTSPFYHGLGLKDFLVIGPGTGSSTGFYLNNIISGYFSNVVTANFSTGMYWDFVEDCQFNSYKAWGCDVGFKSEVFGNNQNVFVNANFNACGTAIRATTGQNNSFFGGLIQATSVDGVVLTTVDPTDAIYRWSFFDIWFEKNITMTGDCIRLGGDEVQLCEFNGCRFVEVGPISLIGGTNNRKHTFQNLLFIGTKTISIPSSMAGVRINNCVNLGVTIPDPSGSAPVFDHMDGSFTATLTDLTTTVTTEIKYTVVGRIVTLYIPSASGTSNSTSFTITGLPIILTPQTNSGFILCRTRNNGSDGLGMFRIQTDSVMYFFSNVDGSTFASSGEKGVLSSTVTYRLDIN